MASIIVAQCQDACHYGVMTDVLKGQMGVDGLVIGDWIRAWPKSRLTRLIGPVFNEGCRYLQRHAGLEALGANLVPRSE